MARAVVGVVLLLIARCAFGENWSILSPNGSYPTNSAQIGGSGSCDKPSGTAFTLKAFKTDGGDLVSNSSAQSGTASWSTNLPKPVGSNWPAGSHALTIHLYPTDSTDTVANQDKKIDTFIAP